MINYDCPHCTNWAKMIKLKKFDTNPGVFKEILAKEYQLATEEYHFWIIVQVWCRNCGTLFAKESIE